MGSSPMQCTGLAQPVERSPFKAVVTGSNPVACNFCCSNTPTTNHTNHTHHTNHTNHTHHTHHTNHTNHTSSICG